MSDMATAVKIDIGKIVGGTKVPQKDNNGRAEIYELPVSYNQRQEGIYPKEVYYYDNGIRMVEPSSYS